MEYSDLYNTQKLYRQPTHQYNCKCRSHKLKPKLEVRRPPNKSFYIHCADARKDTLPRCVRVYRRHFIAKSIDHKQQKAKERRIKFVNERVYRLTEHLIRVERAFSDYYDEDKLKELKLRDHIDQDMQVHLQRRKLYLNNRVMKLQVHNAQVQKLCEILRYQNYLYYIAQNHEEKRKRKGIF